MPSMTAATEWSFSTHGQIHTTKQNRLSTKRSGKLTSVAHNIKLLKLENQSSIAQFEKNISDLEFSEENESLFSEQQDIF